jgi:hypothetical protein
MAYATIPTPSDGNQVSTLGLARPTVVEMRPSYLSAAERAELLASCPHPYRVTLDAVLALAGRTGRLFAAVDRLAARAGMSRRNVQYHRAWLVDNGYLKPQGGGHKGATARYLIARPAERKPASPPPAWARIADLALRADALELEGL